jgi:hypothetical protein
LSLVAGDVGDPLLEPVEPDPALDPDPLVEDPAPLVDAPVLAEPSLFAGLSDFLSLEADAPPAAELPALLSAFFAEAPPAAEPLTPSAESVSWSSWPEAFRFLEVWNSFSAF